jgi:hypothetical protein
MRLKSLGGRFPVYSTEPHAKSPNQIGPSSGLVGIAPGEAIAIVNPSISVAAESVP